MTGALTGQRAIVVGGAGGIGAAAAAVFAQAGAQVTLAGRSRINLEAASASIGGQVAVFDMTDPAAVEAYFAGEEAFDHVVVAAAATRSGSVEALPLDAARASMESKFWGAYHVAKAAKIKRNGSLTFVSGYLANRPNQAAVLQGAINAGIEGLARGLALERAPVRVNTVSPGLVDTPLWGAMADADRSEMFARTAARLPVGRVGAPIDIANAIYFLATNSFATGSTLLVDGGATIA